MLAPAVVNKFEFESDLKLGTDPRPDLEHGTESKSFTSQTMWTFATHTVVPIETSKTCVDTLLNGDDRLVAAAARNKHAGNKHRLTDPIRFRADGQTSVTSSPPMRYSHLLGKQAGRQACSVRI